ncbi:hypothetical protein CNMCM8694_001058 [Aspergillus lentulus]|nr:hypothetical protein CNMCM8060_001384 [Aspergillus lentulus]KAF4191982.1 hypothetical protein CNMCM8694_001058 [Aspergillus lentulus]
MVGCPLCQKDVSIFMIDPHIESNCTNFFKNDKEKPASGSKSNRPAYSSRTYSTSKIKGSNNTPGVPYPHLKIPVKRALPEAERDSKRLQTVSTANLGPGLKKTLNGRGWTNHNATLAERLRPTNLGDVVGQSLVKPGGALYEMVQQNNISHFIMWGGSGTGKTTIARALSRMTDMDFVEIGSVTTSMKEYEDILSKARRSFKATKRKSIIFCDEIHRLSRPQQRLFVDAVKEDTIILVGATTENPSLNLHHTLVYKCRVFTLPKLEDADIYRLLERALKLELTMKGTEVPLSLDHELLLFLASLADGDARAAIELLDLAYHLSERPNMTKERLKQSLTKPLAYDRAGDQHYDTISAFHKSVRGSDPDAALYYLARMLESGENPLFIARRLVVASSEDIGLANNAVLPQATATFKAIESLGLPEARAALAQLTVMMCLSKKSTRSYRGLNNAFAALQEPGMQDLPIPVHLTEQSNARLQAAGVECYKYNLDYLDGVVKQEYLPCGLEGRKFLEDTDFLFQKDPDLEY